MKRKNYFTTVPSKVDDCLFPRLPSSSPVCFRFQLPLTMVFPEDIPASLFLTTPLESTEMLAMKSRMAQSASPPYEKLPLLGIYSLNGLFIEDWDSTGLTVCWQKILWRTNVAYADSLIQNSSRAEMVRMSKGKFQVPNNLVCDRLFVASVREAKYVTNLEALLIQCLGTVGDISRNIPEVYADRAVDYKFSRPPLRKREK